MKKILFISFVVILFSVTARSQHITVSKVSGNATYDGNNTFTGINFTKTLNNVQFADQFSGSDSCVKINNAWSLGLTTTGGFVDAKGFASGANTCGSSPFLTGIHPGTTWIGNSTFQTTASWLIPQGVVLRGIDAPSLASQGGSIIQAVSGFPASTPVIQTGAGSINGTRIEDLNIDCNGQTGAIGAQWNDSEEQSGMRHVQITGCPGTGFLVTGTSGQSQNAGPFEDLYVVSGSAGIPLAGTVGISINKGDSEIRGVHGATVNYTGSSTTPTNCMVINTGGSYSDLHFEGCTNGANVSAPAHHVVYLYNIDCSSNVTDCIHITSGTVVVFSVGGTSTNFINNTVTGETIAGSTSKLPSYFSDQVNAGSSIQFFERGAPSQPPNYDVCYGDSTSHAVLCSYNNSGFLRVPLVIASGATAMTTGAISSLTCGTVVTASASGVVTTDSITINDNAQPAAATNGVLIIKSWPTSNNVNFFYCNPTAGSITPAAATVNWRVVR